MRIPGLGSRTGSATAQTREAATEAALSRRRRETIRREVIEPLEQAGPGDVIAEAVAAVLRDAAAGNGHQGQVPCPGTALPSLLHAGGEDLWRLCLTCPASQSCTAWACARLGTAARNGNSGSNHAQEGT